MTNYKIIEEKNNDLWLNNKLKNYYSDNFEKTCFSDTLIIHRQ